MALRILLLTVGYRWYGNTYPYLLNMFGDVERRVGLLLLLLLGLLIFFLEKLLKLTHFLRVAAFVQILKSGTLSLRVFGVGGGAICQLLF